MPSLHEEKSSAPALTGDSVAAPVDAEREWDFLFAGGVWCGCRETASGEFVRTLTLHTPRACRSWYWVRVRHEISRAVHVAASGGDVSGAVYPLSQVRTRDGEERFLPTLCGGVSPKGKPFFIGSIIDSGWLGGANVGDIVRLRPNGKLPLGIRELRAGPSEFVIDFTAPIDKAAAAKPENYDISGYTRGRERTPRPTAAGTSFPSRPSPSPVMDDG